MFRRREARCCFLVAFVVVVLVSTLALSTDYLDSHFSNISLPKVNVPQWLKPGKNDKIHVSETVTSTPSAQETSSNNTATPATSPSTSESGSNDSDHELKQTRLAQSPHVPGYTVLDNLYLRNGTFFVLTSEEDEFPPTTDIMTHHGSLAQDEKRGASRVAVIDQDLQFVSPKTALLGQYATRISGISVVVLDSPLESPNTFYSWWGEVVLGAWRVSANATALSNHSEEDSVISSRLPSRFILPNADPGSWDNSVNSNGPIMRGGLPNAAVETSEYWQDLRALDSTVVFDRVVLVSRETATARQTQASDTGAVGSSPGGNLDLQESSWDPARKAIVHNLLGYLPDTRINSTAQISQSTTTQDWKPVVALFSTTATRRGQRSGLMGARNYILDVDSHRSLVDALLALEDEGIAEVHVLDTERDGVRMQVELAARSTILIGAHSEALTDQLWMPRSPLSTVIELTRPRIFQPEYEVLARTLGHQHWAVWNDTLVNSDEAFELTSGSKTEDCDKVPLHVDSQVVVQFIKAHLGRREEYTTGTTDAEGTKDPIETAQSQTDKSEPDLEVEILG